MRIPLLMASALLALSACRSPGGDASNIKDASAVSEASKRYICSMKVPNGLDPKQRIDRFDIDNPPTVGSTVAWTAFGFSGLGNAEATNLTVTSVVPQRCPGCYEITATRKTEWAESTYRFVIEPEGGKKTASLKVEYKMTPGGPEDFVSFSNKKGTCQ